MRVISFALTAAQVRAEEKTQTRRLGWEHVRVGDRLRAVLKCQGRSRLCAYCDGGVDVDDLDLPGMRCKECGGAGRIVEPLVDLAIVEVVAVRIERLDLITGPDLDAEGFPPVPGDTIEDRRTRFVSLFPCDGCDPVRVITFKYLNQYVVDRVLAGHPVDVVAADLDLVRVDRAKPGTIDAVRAAVRRSKGGRR